VTESVLVTERWIAGPLGVMRKDFGEQEDPRSEPLKSLARKSGKMYNL
jgi:hypothetical protein